MIIFENFPFFLIKFILFYLFFFFSGRSLIILSLRSKFNDFSKCSGFNIYIFYPIIGIFLFGNFLFISNFLTPINTNQIFIFLLFLFPNLIYKPKFIFLRKALRNFPIYILLIFSSYDVNFHYDSGLYHLGYQALLRESKIIFGMSNIYGPYGIGSIYEYISSALWFDKSFILLHFVNIIFIILFYDFLLSLLFTKSSNILNASGLAILIYSLLDNFGLNGGRNGFLYIQGVGKQDIAVAVLFFISTILIFQNFQNINNILFLDFFILTIFTLFTIQLKISGIPIALLYVYFLFKVSSKKNFKYNILLKLVPIYIIGFFWLIKSFIQTGCFIYPLESSCINSVAWYSQKYTKVSLESAQMFSISYNFNSPLNIWFNQFINYEINKTILVNFLASTILIYFIFFKHTKLNTIYNIKPILYFLIFNIFFYLYFGAHLRYLIPIQLLVIFLIGINRVSRIKINNLAIYFLAILSVFTLVRLNSYKSFDFFSQPNLEIPETNVISYNSRFLPQEGDQCWIITNCSPNLENYVVEYFANYKIVKLEK